MNTKNREKHLSKRSGFTLIEIILVVVIIGILASIAIPHFSGKTEMAQFAQARSNIAVISSALDLYEISNGVYPSTLDTLLDSSQKGYPFLRKQTIPKDPWGNSFIYSAPGSHNTHLFDIYTTAPKSGTVIGNWDE